MKYKKKAVIFADISELSDFDHELVDHIASNFFIYNKKKHLYIYDFVQKDFNAEELLFAINNWYRNKHCVDDFSKLNFSIWSVISRRLFFQVTAKVKNYNALLNVQKQYDTVYISNSLKRDFYSASLMFDNINWFDSDHTVPIENQSNPELGLIYRFPKIHKLSDMARIIQKPFHKFIQNKILVWPDWTYKKELCDNSFLNLNKLNLFKSFYLLNTVHSRQALKIFPKKLTITIEDIDINLKHKCISLDKDIVSILKNEINQVYCENYLNLRRTYSIFEELYCYYKPKAVVFPGEAHFAYVIGSQLAKIYNIKTILAVDGYPILPSEYLHYKLIDGKSNLFDGYVSYGTAHKKLLKRHGIPSESILNCKFPPVVNSPPSSLTDTSSKTVAVMSYYPDLTSVNSRWDKRLFFTMEIVDLLIKIGEKRVVIKIKDGCLSKQEFELYSDYISSKNYKGIVSVSIGEFTKLIPHCTYIIGQISTALFESAAFDVPYFIYEPFQNGVSDRKIDESEILERRDICRNLYELHDKIVKFNSPLFHQLSDGSSMRGKIIEFCK